MTKILTLFGRDISDLTFNELKREKQAEKFILMAIRQRLKAERKRNAERHKALEENDCQANRWSVTATDDKIVLLEAYETHLEALIKDIDFYLDRRAEPMSNYNPQHNRKKDIRARNAKRRSTVIRDNAARYKWEQSIERDGLLVGWDREKFLQVARDNGYQTEEALVWAVADELKLDRTRASIILNKGRFTWGQVLCLGAMLEMTPKEFCDTFLAGYFVDKYGEYVADYDNLCREEMLKRAIKPKSIMDDMVEVEVGADGKPVDEEEWFD